MNRRDDDTEPHSRCWDHWVWQVLAKSGLESLNPEALAPAAGEQGMALCGVVPKPHS